MTGDNSLKIHRTTNESEKSFFLNSDMFNIVKNKSPVEILEYIKTHSPISIWDLSKKLEVNRNQLYYLLRNFEFAGLIKSRLRVNKSNHKVRMIYYNLKK